MRYFSFLSLIFFWCVIAQVLIMNCSGDSRLHTVSSLGGVVSLELCLQYELCQTPIYALNKCLLKKFFRHFNNIIYNIKLK